MAFPAMLLLTACFGHAQDIVGDWQGTLSFGDIEQRLVLHIMKNADGTLKATVDAVDLAQNNLPVTAFDLAAYRLTFNVDAIDASFRGKVMGDGKTIMGKWLQGRPIFLEFKRAVAPVKTEHKPAKPSDIDGTWIGTLQLGDRQMRIVCQIANTEDGLMANLGSPDEGPEMFPATAVTREGSSLKIEAKQFGGVFAGRIAADHSAIDGTWMQGDHSLPLVLKPSKNTPQTGNKSGSSAK